MPFSWIISHPEYYAQELQRLAHHYPDLQVNEELLQRRVLALSGDLIVRPPGGAKRYPIILFYRSGTPYEHPTVIALEALPKTNDGPGFAECTTTQALGSSASDA